MVEWLHRLVIPTYVLLCLLLGGSVQGVWRVMALQLLAIVLIAWAGLTPKGESLTGASKGLLLLVILTLLLFILQLIPLPPEIWTRLPGREVVERGYENLGYSLPWLPVSMAPYETLATWLALLPPVAVLAGILRLRAYDESWLAGAVIAGALFGVLLGAVQSLGGVGPEAWWYLYEHTNDGAVGFFANRNLMGTLLLVSIPFTAALLASGNQQTGKHGKTQALLAIGAAGLLVVLVGLALNHSLAAVALALPVLAFSTLILPSSWPKQRLVAVVAALLTVVAILIFTSSPIRAELSGADTTSLETRRWMWTLSWSAITDRFPVGTGLGSFEQVFRLYEDPSSVDATFVNHAHNDYLELLVEAGLPGLLILGAFLLWWVRQTARVWRSSLSSHFARAATVASGAILAHSAVDYPLRTAAIAAVFAACVAVMAQPGVRRRSRSSTDQSPAESRAAKHLVIG